MKLFYASLSLSAVVLKLAYATLETDPQSRRQRHLFRVDEDESDILSQPDSLSDSDVFPGFDHTKETSKFFTVMKEDKEFFERFLYSDALSFIPTPSPTKAPGPTTPSLPTPQVPPPPTPTTPKPTPQLPLPPTPSPPTPAATPAPNPPPTRRPTFSPNPDPTPPPEQPTTPTPEPPTPVLPTPPTPPTPTAPTPPTNPRTLDLPIFMISYSAPNATRAPNAAEYEQLREGTDDFYTEYLAEYFRTTDDPFSSLDLVITSTEYRPGAEFNIEVLFDFSPVFVDSTPTLQEFLDAVPEADLLVYITDFVRPLVGTPFESTRAVELTTDIDGNQPGTPQPSQTLPVISSPTPPTPTPPSPTPPNQDVAESIIDVVVEESNLEVLEDAVIAARLAPTLFSGGPYTLFAPTDTAFGDLDQSYLDMLLEPQWILHLTNLLLYHALDGTVLSTDLTDGADVTMSNGEGIAVSLQNGVTVSGENFNAANVVEADLLAGNGVVHKVDTVFIPDFIATDLYDLASETESFSTLVTLIDLADLEDTLRAGQFTVLAPTDDAFDALSPETVAFLTASENIEVLENVLLYHVLPGVVPSTMLTNGQQYEAANGEPVAVSVDGSTVRFNEADVVAADVLASNGIVHAIDSVLIPPDFDIPTTPDTRPTATFALDPIFIAYDAPDASRSPNDSEYDQVLENTHEFFTNHLSGFFFGTRYEFVSLEANIVDASYNQGIPQDNFNIYVEYQFTPSFVSPTLPSSDVLIAALSTLDLETYISDAVRSLDGTPFASTDEVELGFA